MTKDSLRQLAAFSLIGSLILSFSTSLHADDAEQSAQPLSGTLYVGGTGASVGILKLLTNAYKGQHPGVSTVVYPSLGTGGGISALEAGKLTVSFSSRELKESERNRGLRASRILRTPFIFATHSAIDITNLTLSQIAAILSGKVTEWPDGTLIRPVLRPIEDTDTQILMNISEDLRNGVLNAHSRIGKNVAATDSEAADELESIKGSFGMTTLLLVKSESRNINILELDGVMPNLATIQSGDYPFEKSLYAVTTQDSSALANSFVAYLNTDEARELIREHGGLPGKR